MFAQHLMSAFTRTMYTLLLNIAFEIEHVVEHAFELLAEFSDTFIWSEIDVPVGMSVWFYKRKMKKHSIFKEIPFYALSKRKNTNLAQKIKAHNFVAGEFLKSGSCSHSLCRQVLWHLTFYRTIVSTSLVRVSNFYWFRPKPKRITIFHCFYYLFIPSSMFSCQCSNSSQYQWQQINFNINRICIICHMKIR